MRKVLLSLAVLIPVGAVVVLIILLQGLNAKLGTVYSKLRDQQKTSDAERQSLQEQIRHLQVESERLQQAVEQARQEADIARRSSIRRPDTVEVPLELLTSFHIFDPETRIACPPRTSPQLAEILNLTAEQQKKMDAIYASLWQVLAHYESAGVQVTKNDTRGFELTVQPFADGGKAVRERLEDSVRTVLDDLQYRAWRQIELRNLSEPFLAFGEGTLTLTISAEKGRFRVEEQRKSENGGSSSSSSGTRRGEDFGALARFHKWFPDWIQRKVPPLEMGDAPDPADEPPAPEADVF